MVDVTYEQLIMSHFVECRCGENHYANTHYAESHYAEGQCTECRCGEYLYAEFHYVEFCCAECSGPGLALCLMKHWMEISM